VRLTSRLAVPGAMACGVVACLAAAPSPQVMGQHRNRDYGFTVTIPAGLAGATPPPPAPQHGFSIPLGAARDRLSVNADYDAALTFSVDAIASDWAAELQRREPRLKLSSQKPVTLDGLDAVESVFDAEPDGAVAHARHVIALRPQAGGVGIVYAIVLELRAVSKEADDVFARVANSFRMTDISRGTSPDESRLLQQQMSLVGCWVADPSAPDALRNVGLHTGDTVNVKFGHGHVDGMDGDARSDADDLHALLPAPDGKHGYLVMGFPESDGRITVSGGMTYHLSRDGAHWSAGGGNGGLSTYSAIGRYADKLDKQRPMSLPLRPAPEQRCAK
jgi:hypothetical protein